jgi:hypothetical protein
MANRIKNWWQGVSRLTKIISAGIALIGLISAILGIRTWWQDDAKAQFAVKQAKRKFRVLVPLFASSQEYLRFMELGLGEWYDEEKYSKKVSRDFLNAIKASANNWFANYKPVKEMPFDKEKVDFYHFPEGYDEETYKKSFEMALQHAMHDGREVVGVIGNVTSTVTQEYGKLCGGKVVSSVIEEYGKLHEGNMKFPMILPLATATNVTHQLINSGVPAVLRLPPANEKQTKLISDFLLNQPGKAAVRALIVKDLSNLVYSTDLVDNFRTHFVLDPLETAQNIRRLAPNAQSSLPFGRILGVMPAGGERGAPFLYPAIERLQPDALLLFGMTECALETLLQADASRLQTKYTILTDGAVDEYLIPRVVGILSENQIKSIYLTFPLENPEHPCVNPVMSVLEEKDRRNLDMTHAIYVIDAAQIMLSVLEERIVKQGDARPASVSVAETIDKWRKEAERNKSKSIEIKFPCSDRKYIIDQFGNTTNIEYHIFRAEFSKRSMIKGTVNQIEVKWKHHEQCPCADHQKGR